MWHAHPRLALRASRWTSCPRAPASAADSNNVLRKRSLDSNGSSRRGLSLSPLHHQSGSCIAPRAHPASCHSIPIETRWGSSKIGGPRGRRRLLSTESGTSATGGDGAASVSKPRDANSSAVDGAALLRRVAIYIEEDPRAADKLGAVMGEATGRKIASALDGMEYAVREPSWKDLRRVAFISAVPFVGFGVMDNAIMIVAGEYIDMTVGIAMGISTMAAAALGNTISDMAGVGLGGFIESMATMLGLPQSKLSRAQMLLRTTRTASLVGSAVGVMVGCLIGMFPLLLLPDSDVVEAVKRKEKIVGLIDAVVEEAAAFLSAASATLYILDREQGTLWARSRGLPGTPNAGAVQDLRIELADRGPVSDAARSGEAVHAHGGKGGKGGAMPSMLCMPVFGADGQVAGVVQVVGKKTGGRVPNGFTAEDAKDLSALCSHISVALENIKRTAESDEVDLRETIALMQSYGDVNQPQPFPQHRPAGSARIAPIGSARPGGDAGGAIDGK